MVTPLNSEKIFSVPVPFADEGIPCAAGRAPAVVDGWAAVLAAGCVAVPSASIRTEVTSPALMVTILL